MYIPQHSDFIIHWTGIDIEKRLDKKYGKNPKDKDVKENKKKERNDQYIKRLRSILKWGLWMNKDRKDRFIKTYKKISKNNYKTLKIGRPWLARTCFTELKLSMAQDHANEFGKLGIGFKRPFLFDRLGSPVMYYHPSQRNWFFPTYMGKRFFDKNTDFFSCFYKEMCPKKSKTRKFWEYLYYDESEWRIIFSEELKQKLETLKRNDVSEKFIKTEDERKKDAELNKYLNEIGRSPEFLIPLDGWLSMIIYPNLYIKQKAQEEGCEIRKLIKKAKDEGDMGKEKENFPVELDIAACRNF
jgi:hypothetical protein